MSALIPDWLAWWLVRWQCRKYEVVRVDGLIAQFLHGGGKFQHSQTGLSYRAIAVKRIDPKKCHPLEAQRFAALVIVEPATCLIDKDRNP